jgi:hypothetical protein
MKLISKTNFDLTTLFAAMQAYTGKDCKVGGENNVNTVIKSLNNPDLLNHIHFTFLTAQLDETIIDILQSLRLKVIIIDETGSPKLIFLTASLEDWKYSIIKGSNLFSRPILNNLLKSAYTHFKNVENLGFIFDDHQVMNKNGQIKFLENRK